MKPARIAPGRLYLPGGDAVADYEWSPVQRPVRHDCQTGKASGKCDTGRAARQARRRAKRAGLGKAWQAAQLRQDKTQA